MTPVARYIHRKLNADNVTKPRQVLVDEAVEFFHILA